MDMAITAAIDFDRMRRYRYGRLQSELKKRNLGGAILFDPVNVRYAVDVVNYAIYSLHSPLRCVFVPADGKSVLFDHDDERIETIAPTMEFFEDVRPLPIYHFFYAGNLVDQLSNELANQLSALMSVDGRKGMGLAVDRFEPCLANAMTNAGLKIVDAQAVLESARVIKSDDEVACIEHSISIAQKGLQNIRDALQPGVTDNELCAVLQNTNFANGGEWNEYRLICSGPRTNPWGQEATDRPVNSGELTIVDTGMVGPNGYFADVSRTFLCPPAGPTDEQKRLYGLAHQNICYNMDILGPGVGFREFSEKCWTLPPEFVSDRYPTPMHGTGMRGEWPMLAYPIDFAKRGIEGEFQPGMIMAVESYLGPDGGSQGVKLEEQVLITETGYRKLSTFPYEEEMLA